MLYTYLSKIINAIFLWQVTLDLILNFSLTYYCHVQSENLVTFLDFRLSRGSVATYVDILVMCT